jgi:hypothetical protein
MSSPKDATKQTGLDIHGLLVGLQILQGYTGRDDVVVPWGDAWDGGRGIYVKDAPLNEMPGFVIEHLQSLGWRWDSVLEAWTYR